MKLALISPGPIPAQTANSMQVMKMAQALLEVGHALRVFAPDRGVHPDWPDLAAHYGLTRQIEIRRLPARPVLRSYDFTFGALGAAQTWSAELIYTRLPQAAALAARRGWPTIFELHDVPSGVMGPWLLRVFLRSRGARRVVVNTQYLAGEIMKRYQLPAQELIVVAPNGVDLQRYAKLPNPESARKQLKLKEAFTVGYSGHLYKGRGIGFILELARRLPKLQFLLVGGRGEHVAARQEQASGLDNVRFTGFVPNTDLPMYQAACDVLLVPYSRQVAGSSGADIAPYTNPLKMFEYLAAGRPIVASDLPILREVLSEQNAVILPVGDLEAWVQALVSLQESPSRRAALAQAGQHTAAEFTWEKRAKHILRGMAAAG